MDANNWTELSASQGRDLKGPEYKIFFKGNNNYYQGLEMSLFEMSVTYASSRAKPPKLGYFRREDTKTVQLKFK